MTHTELIHQIRGIIEDLTGKEYLRPILVKDLEPQGYSVGFETRQYDPTWYAAELPDDEFLQFIRKELQHAKFLKIEYVKAVRNTTLDHPLNDFRSPYDLSRINGEDR